jgi:hypothetical protein
VPETGDFSFEAEKWYQSHVHKFCEYDRVGFIFTFVSHLVVHLIVVGPAPLERSQIENMRFAVSPSVVRRPVR